MLECAVMDCFVYDNTISPASSLQLHFLSVDTL